MTHVRRLGATSALLLVALPLCGCEQLIKRLKGDSSESGGDTPSEKSSPKGKATSGCVIPPRVEADVTVKKGCSVTIKENTEVKSGATLTIEQGVKIAVEQGYYLWVYDGKVVAKGTEKEPIVFTTANKTAAPGDWVGIGFDDKTQAGTVLDFVHVEYAGSSAGGGHAAIELRNQHSPKRIAITNTQVTNSAQAAVLDESENGGFAKFEKNVFKKNKTSLEAHTRVLGSVGPGNVFSDPLETTGAVKETTTWPLFDAPIVVKEAFEIGGDKSPATLTIAPKTVLKMNPGSYISVGTANGGSLVANGVTFTSSNGTPHPGDWVGLFIYARTSTLLLEGATLEYGGAESAGGRAAITFYNTDAKKVPGAKITNVTFRNNANAAMSSGDHDCSPFTAGNRVEGSPFCRPQ